MLYEVVVTSYVSLLQTQWSPGVFSEALLTLKFHETVFLKLGKALILFPPMALFKLEAFLAFECHYEFCSSPEFLITERLMLKAGQGGNRKETAFFRNPAFKGTLPTSSAKVPPDFSDSPTVCGESHSKEFHGPLPTHHEKPEKCFTEPLWSWICRTGLSHWNVKLSTLKTYTIQSFEK